MSINIPQNFSAILNGDSDIQGNVAHLCSNIQDLFKLNPDFFPDYTFHGIDHINEILDHADHLIPDKTRDILTSRDIAFLVSAIVIHDVGMFLAEDGVRRLISGDLRQQQLNGFEDDTWANAWEDYTDRVKRYTQEKMLHLFGSNITVDPDCAQKQPITGDNDRRVIGEFLRQTHPRLAHEIAVNFFPGDKDTDVFANTSFDETDRDMIGLLARSHGMAIRDMEDYCEENYEEGSKPCNIPIFYLMAVLRIADLLDAGSHRAPKIRLDTKKIHIPISVEEWTWNQRITPKKCKWDTQKGKRHIFAEPTTSIEYVQLDQWLSRLQAELDLSWSVLSEKYPSEDYRLSIHRVTSNIREAAARKKMDEKFLTKEAKVTANPEIVKLMMAPLYGDDPSYGVRELLQNAVDACIERERKEGSGYKGEVTIRVDEKYFVIEDNGIGMDENVLLNYYLSAGSSYRDSDEWKRDFTENGESQIARTGRFGVGFLASFLLGDEISVHTQHMDGQKGYAFSFNQESRPLNIRREERPEGTGTTITIRLNARIHQQLTYIPTWYDWYFFDNPKVTYYLDGKAIHSSAPRIPRNPGASATWFQLRTENYENYLWTFRHHADDQYIGWVNSICCNGFLIREFPPIIGEDFGFGVNSPFISLMDPHNNLRIDLSRNRVLAVPEEEKLIRELYPYVIACILLCTWDCQAGLNIPLSDPVPCLRHGKNFLPYRPEFLSAARITRYVTVFDLSDNSPALPHPVDTLLTADIPMLVMNPCLEELLIHYIEPHSEGTVNGTLWQLLSPFSSIDENSWIYPCRSLWLTTDDFSSMPQSLADVLGVPGMQKHAGICEWNLSDLPFHHDLWDQAKALGSVEDWDDIEELEAMRYKYAQYDMPIDPAKFAVGNYGFAADCIGPDGFTATLFSEMLHEYLGEDIWIPIDMEERKKKFPKAFKELASHMEHLRKHPDI